jgi:hypothetical protein
MPQPDQRRTHVVLRSEHKHAGICGTMTGRRLGRRRVRRPDTRKRVVTSSAAGGDYLSTG